MTFSSYTFHGNIHTVVVVVVVDNDGDDDDIEP